MRSFPRANWSNLALRSVVYVACVLSGPALLLALNGSRVERLRAVVPLVCAELKFSPRASRLLAEESSVLSSRVCWMAGWFLDRLTLLALFSSGIGLGFRNRGSNLFCTAGGCTMREDLYFEPTEDPEFVRWNGFVKLGFLSRTPIPPFRLPVWERFDRGVSPSLTFEVLRRMLLDLAVLSPVDLIELVEDLGVTVPMLR